VVEVTFIPGSAQTGITPHQSEGFKKLEEDMQTGPHRPAMFEVALCKVPDEPPFTENSGWAQFASEADLIMACMKWTSYRLVSWTLKRDRPGDPMRVDTMWKRPFSIQQHEIDRLSQQLKACEEKLHQERTALSYWQETVRGWPRPSSEDLRFLTREEFRKGMDELSAGIRAAMRPNISAEVEIAAEPQDMADNKNSESPDFIRVPIRDEPAKLFTDPKDDIYGRTYCTQCKRQAAGKTYDPNNSCRRMGCEDVRVPGESYCFIHLLWTIGIDPKAARYDFKPIEPVALRYRYWMPLVAAGIFVAGLAVASFLW